MHAEVIRTEWVTSHLVQVVLGGQGLDEFEPSPFADSYLNCLFPAQGDGAGARGDRASDHEDGRPDGGGKGQTYPRRISVRRWDRAVRELTVLVASHGDLGHAGRWAAGARPGDRLEVRGPAGDYTPHPDATSCLLVGDESALPAIAACAEAVPVGRRVVVVAEVEDEAGQLELRSPGDLRVHWVHRAGKVGLDTLLADTVAALPRPDGGLSAFVHGEAVSTRAVRRVLLRERRVDPTRLSCSPYWRRGYDDEQWRHIKGDWLRAVNAETLEAI